MKRYIFGSLLIVIGVIWALASFDLVDFELFFDGWWAVLIFLFCAGNLFTSRDKVGPCLGMGISIVLFLAERNLLEWSNVGQLVIALCLVALGFKVIVGRSQNHRNSTTSNNAKTINRDGKDVEMIEVSFGNQKISYANEVFENVMLKTSFGAAQLDLREAIINGEANLTIEAGFAGVKIIVPEGLAVKTFVKSGFGGVQDKRSNRLTEGTPTLYIQGEVGFAGVEINTI